MVKPYAVEFLPEARDNLDRINKSDSQHILNKIKWLANNFDSVSHEALTGEFKGLYKLRVGDFRVIYSSLHTERLIMIHMIGHRRNIYERR